MQASIDWSKVTIEDLMKNPKKFGLPNFKEYCQAREKWRPDAKPDDSMVVLTDGPKEFRKDLNKIIFKVNGLEMSENQVEKALGDYGYTLADIDIENRNSKLKKELQMIPLGGGKYDIEVNFIP